MTAIRVEDLTFAYKGRPILAEITLAVKAGEFFALIGPNGSGKTTLLRAISGVIPMDTGTVYLDFVDGQSHPVSQLAPKELARSLAALEQEVHVAFDFTVRETVSLGRLPHSRKLKPLAEEDRRVVEEAMERVGVAQFADRSIHSLSSGERQRVFLAMALAQEPKVLLLDEPTAHLDLKYQIEIMELIRGLSKRGLTVICALHDLNLAARYADRVGVLSQGRLVACGPPDEVFTLERIREIWHIEIEIFKESGEIWILPRSSVRSASQAVIRSS